MTKWLSIIVPVLNEAEGIAEALRELAPLRTDGAELIVVDGGSVDATRERCAGLADSLVLAPRGRARQMNEGARRASGSVLLFLHADTRLPPDAAGLITRALAEPRREWGRFDVCIVGGG